MKKYLLAIAVAVSFHAANACDEVSITDILADGAVIETDDGTKWEVDGGDQATASSWSVGDDLLSCDGMLINKDDGERVSVTQH